MTTIDNSNDRLLQHLMRAFDASGLALTKLGARSLVLSQFADAVLPLLSPTQCAEAAIAFRARVEDVMALMDDRRLPADYHSSFLDETNGCLNKLAELSRLDSG
ncbi:hypothetical protein SAMN05446935_8207 [Burkholderia sp. YR290]|nr:hypothetical protein SAMN05446935_8207 [Burkholderia sp. YR290]